MHITGSCHCGEVSFKIAGEIPAKLTRCTCSFCSKLGVLYAYYKPEQFELNSSREKNATYRWQSNMVAHYFCPTCGAKTYSDTSDFKSDGSWDGATRRVGVNARLFDNFVAANHPFVELDGKNLW